MKLFTFLITICISFLGPKNEISISHDYYDGIELAKEKGKPIFLLFTGRTCRNNESINEILMDKEISDQLLSDFIPIVLYVDDKTKLANEKKVYRNGKTSMLRTKGHEWAHLEITKFNSNAQPLIVILDTEEGIIKEPIQGKISKKDIKEYLSK